MHVCVCGYGSKTKGMDCSGVIRTFFEQVSYGMRGEISGPIAKVY